MGPLAQDWPKASRTRARMALFLALDVGGQGELCQGLGQILAPAPHAEVAVPREVVGEKAHAELEGDKADAVIHASQIRLA